MKNKMSWSGIGPRLALITLPYLILALFLIYRDPTFLVMNFLSPMIAKIIGYSLLVVGFVFYITSAKTFFPGFKKGELITHGPYKLCRNPIYAAFIILFIPALACIFRSGILLTVDLVLYLNFKVLIREEYMNLRNIFGEQYNQYEKAVNEILPIPKFWVKK